MSDPSGSGRRSSGGNVFPNLMDVLSDMSDRSDDYEQIESDPFPTDFEYDSSSSDVSVPNAENREDDFDLFIDNNVGEGGYYVALFLQRIIARFVAILLFFERSRTHIVGETMHLTYVLTIHSTFSFAFSGHVHMIDSNLVEPFFRAKLPVIKQPPNLDKLKASTQHRYLSWNELLLCLFAL